MNEETTNYNLIDEKWIPVLWSNGEYSRVGIMEALTQAHKIREIAASNPMDRVAIIRFLLALLYWCRGSPDCETEKTMGDSFPSEWFKKLEEHKECFNLLGDGNRFYQYRKSGDKPLSANYLIHEVPTGTNFWHFRHATERNNGLCYSCCAMGLLRLPIFSTSGGRGKPPGINYKPPIYIIPVGDSLKKTLIISWRKVPECGTPAWENPDIELPREGEVPLLTGLTWLPRRVWLENPEGPEDNCISCGYRGRLIKKAVFAGTGSTKKADGSKSRIWRDPHVLYQKDKKGEMWSIGAADALSAHDAAAGQWTRAIKGILEENKAEGAIWIVGFSTVQNDKYVEATELMLQFSSLPEKSVEDVTDLIEQWGKEGKKLGKGISRSKLARSLAINTIRPHVEKSVSLKAPELVSGNIETWDKAANEYRPMMTMIAKSTSPGFTTRAVTGRKKISGIRPYLRQEKKGDDE